MNTIKRIAILFAVILLSACVATPVYGPHGEYRGSATTVDMGTVASMGTGAAIGALAGELLGGDAGRGAALGAVVGGLTAVNPHRQSSGYLNRKAPSGSRYECRNQFDSNMRDLDILYQRKEYHIRMDVRGERAYNHQMQNLRNWYQNEKRETLRIFDYCTNR